MTYMMRIATLLAALTFSLPALPLASAEGAARAATPTQTEPARGPASASDAATGVALRERPRGQRVGLVALFGVLAALGVLLVATARGAEGERL